MNTTHTFGSTKQRAHSFDVSIRKIGYVDIIAHAGSIRSRMIIAEYVERAARVGGGSPLRKLNQFPGSRDLSREISKTGQTFSNCYTRSCRYFNDMLRDSRQN
jgi:hypothetical protein